MGTKTQKLSNVVDQIVEWQSVFTGDGSTGLTAVAGRGYFIDTTSGAVTVTLPASPKAGDIVQLKDYARTWATNNITIASFLRDGITDTSTFSTNGQTVTFVYMDGTKGWSLINEDTTTDLSTSFIVATGGTITTSGDYKIHTFTGDGCFVVSTAPAGSGPGVDYLVVAGGGGGGRDIFPANRPGGGGGAGGFRMSNSLCLPAPTTSPLANPTGITVSATTYPITVGAGGVGGNSTPGTTVCGGVGNPSIFSPITSAGGGGGIGHNTSYGVCTPNPHSNTQNGGSGGGAGDAWPIGLPDGIGRGNGNYPPVSPPQGNPAGTSWAGVPNYFATGGGGAGAPGGAATTPKGGDGGVGSYVSPSFAVGCAGTTGPVPGVRYFSGGGGSHTGGTGGSGGGADSGNPGTNPGVANTGGGGGGARNSDGGAGGKGIVIIRYKYQ